MTIIIQILELSLCVKKRRMKQSCLSLVCLVIAHYWPFIASQGTIPALVPIEHVVLVGEKLEIRCAPRLADDRFLINPTLTWEKFSFDDPPLKFIGEKRWQEIATNSSGSILKLRRIEAQDEGYYLCTIEYPHSQAKGLKEYKLHRVKVTPIYYVLGTLACPGLNSTLSLTVTKVEEFQRAVHSIIGTPFRSSDCSLVIVKSTPIGSADLPKKSTPSKPSSSCGYDPTGICNTLQNILKEVTHLRQSIKEQDASLREEWTTFRRHLFTLMSHDSKSMIQIEWESTNDTTIRRQAIYSAGDCVNLDQQVPRIDHIKFHIGNCVELYSAKNCTGNARIAYRGPVSTSPLVHLYRPGTKKIESYEEIFEDERFVFRETISLRVHSSRSCVRNVP